MAEKTDISNTKKQCWFVYMIEADDTSLYTGITTDVSRRFKEHTGSVRGAKYLRSRKPVAVRYVEECTDRSQASQREYQIKSLSAQQKRQLIASMDKSRLEALV